MWHVSFWRNRMWWLNGCEEVASSTPTTRSARCRRAAGKLLSAICRLMRFCKQHLLKISSVRGSLHSILLAPKRARIAKVKAYKTYVAPQASPILQLQWCFCVTDSACVQPIDRGPSLRPWTLTCNQTAIHSPGLPFDDLHPRNLYNYIDYYSFTNPKGMEGWVGCL